MTNTAAETTEQTRDLGDRAVILGGSMAGLLAARVLAEQLATVGENHRSTRNGGVRGRAGEKYDWR